MHFVLAYLVLPVVLHEPTRETLPSSNKTKLSTWIMRHPEVRAGLPERCQALLPFTTSALSFLLGSKAVTVDERGFLSIGNITLRGVTSFPKLSSEVGRCWSRALLLGELFGSVPRPSRVLISLGVRL